LHLGDDEVVSGWKLSMIKSEDELAYSLSLVRTEESINQEEENLIFVSDEQGVIFVGGANAEREMPKQYRKADSVRGTIPIDEASSVVEKRSKFGIALRNLAFAGLQSPQSPDFCGNCSCSCFSSGQ